MSDIRPYPFFKKSQSLQTENRATGSVFLEAMTMGTPPEQIHHETVLRKKVDRMRNSAQREVGKREQVERSTNEAQGPTCTTLTPWIETGFIKGRHKSHAPDHDCKIQTHVR